MTNTNQPISYPIFTFRWLAVHGLAVPTIFFIGCFVWRRASSSTLSSREMGLSRSAAHTSAGTDRGTSEAEGLYAPRGGGRVDQAGKHPLRWVKHNQIRSDHEHWTHSEAAAPAVEVAEVAVGKALKEYKDDGVMVATKCGVLPEEENKPKRFISRDTILEEVDGSLRRLNRDWIDLYQIHWPEPIENLEEAWETLQDLKKAGKIRWAGVCNCWEPELEKLQGIAEVTSNQPMYSMLERSIEKEVLPWSQKNNCKIFFLFESKWQTLPFLYSFIAKFLQPSNTSSDFPFSSVSEGGSILIEVIAATS